MQLCHLGSQAYIYQALLSFIAVFVFIFIFMWIFCCCHCSIKTRNTLHNVSLTNLQICRCHCCCVLKLFGGNVLASFVHLQDPSAPLCSEVSTDLLARGIDIPDLENVGLLRTGKSQRAGKSLKWRQVLWWCVFSSFLLLHLAAALVPFWLQGGSVRLFQARDPQKLVHVFFKSVEGAKEEAMRSDWEKLNSSKFN